MEEEVCWMLYLAFCGAQNIVFVVVCDGKQWLKLTSEIREKANKILSIKALK